MDCENLIRMTGHSDTGGVHHWDENGLRRRADEPPEIQKIHAEIVDFVTKWLKDWKSTNN